MGEGLDPLDRVVPYIDPDPTEFEGAVAVGRGSQICILDPVTEALSRENELLEIAELVISSESSAQLGQRLTFRLRYVEDGYGFESPHLLAGRIRGDTAIPFVDQRGEYPNGMFSWSHLTAESLPGAVAGNVGGVWPLRRDQHGVSPGVPVKSGLYV